MVNAWRLPPTDAEQTGQIIDLSVRLGSSPALWLTARLLALPVSPQIAEQRRAHLLEKARDQGHVPSAEALALADWNLMVTNIPAALLQAQEVSLLYRARWQMEIVQSQMTKTKMFAGGGGGDHVTDLHLLADDHDAVNQQFNQLPFLFKGGLS